MKKATLDQAQKVLSLLEGFSCDEVQEALAMGTIVKGIRDCRDLESRRISQIWETVRAVTDNKFKGIVITVPHDPHPNNGHGNRKFQVRCWRAGAEFGPIKGHIDGGVDIFETFLEKRLDDCDCCWPDQLRDAGLSGGGFREWQRETLTAWDGSKYDRLTRKQEEVG